MKHPPITTGRVRYDAARAVRYRDGDDMHSAVHAPIFISVNSLTEADKIIKAWPDLMEALKLKVDDILTSKDEVKTPDG